MNNDFNKIYKEKNSGRLKGIKNFLSRYYFILILIFLEIFIYFIPPFENKIMLKFIRYIIGILIIIIMFVIIIIKVFKKEKVDFNYHYKKNYIEYFLENYGTKIFDCLSYQTFSYEKEPMLNENRIVDESYFTASGKIGENNFSMTADDNYVIRKTLNNDDLFNQEKRFLTSGITVTINTITKVSSCIKYVGLNHFENKYETFINNGEKIKINHKKLKTMYKVYGRYDTLPIGGIKGDFADVLCKITSKLTKIPFFPPDIKITVDQNEIVIFVGIASMFNDFLPLKVKDKMYYKKFLYIRKLCEIFIMQFSKYYK